MGDFRPRANLDGTADNNSGNKIYVGRARLIARNVNARDLFITMKVIRITPQTKGASLNPYARE
jgi:hypothetical protein